MQIVDSILNLQGLSVLGFLRIFKKGQTSRRLSESWSSENVLFPKVSIKTEIPM